MTLTKTGVAVLAIILSCVPATAGTVITDSCAGACGFQAWAAGNLNQDGNPYFDNPSSDGSQLNVGYFLTGTGGFAGHPDSPNAALPFYGTAAGGAAQNYIFTVSPVGTPYSGTLVLEVAGFAGGNEFGWYEAGDRNSRTTLLTGPDSAGDPIAFTPTANFGFYLAAPDGNFYFTESTLNGTAGGTVASLAFQHMALFSGSANAFWMGVEDKTDPNETVNPRRIGDFNDMVLQISEVPEPGTYAMLAAGLLAVGLAKFRRRAS